MSLLAEMLTPEARAERGRRQAELRERYGHRLAASPAQANYLYGAARAETALAQLADLGGEGPDSLFDQLAEGLALQGRFADAAGAARDAARAAEYAKKAEALSRAGDPSCDCPEFLSTPTPLDAKGSLRPSRRKVEEVFDGARVVSFVLCESCGSYGAEVRAA